jgi:hypothetical protein
MRVCLPRNRNCWPSICRCDDPQGNHRITLSLYRCRDAHQSPSLIGRFRGWLAAGKFTAAGMHGNPPLIDIVGQLCIVSGRRDRA